MIPICQIVYQETFKNDQQFQPSGWLKIYSQKLVSFLYTYNEYAQKVIMNILSFTTAFKTIKYLEINQRRQKTSTVQTSNF